MPIYEYGCDLCRCMWEEVQKFSDPVLTECKGCGKEGGVRKLFSGKIAFHLKGGGWYKDGYSSEDQTLTDAQRKVNELKTNPKKEKQLYEDAFEGNVPKEEDVSEDEILINQNFIRDPALTINDLIKEAIGKLGENIQIRRIARFSLGE